jgi:hypothetical protein
VTTLRSDTPVDVNSPEPWPAPLLAAVAESDAHVAGAECPGDLEIRAISMAAIWAALRGNRLIVRHFTRLLPHEVESIRTIGLELYSRALFDRRIEDANAHGYFDETTARRLKAITIPAAEASRSRGRAFVCFTAGRMIEQEPENVAELISNWGGEGIYFAAGAQQDSHLLRSLGEPTAVHVGLLLESESRPLFFPAIEKLLLGRFRNLSGIVGDVLSPDAIPPEAIIKIETLEPQAS